MSSIPLPRSAIPEGPPEPELPLLHDRTYSVRAYRQSDTELRLRGQIRDQKPPGVYVDDDPDPLTVHHMVVDLVIAFPSLEIIEAEVVMETHPHGHCPTITDHYASLVGLSIARGYTHKVRELFGGPRGCTHTTALLQAMAPVAVQSIWSMRASSADEGTPVDLPLATGPDGKVTDEAIRERFAHNLNSCHVWAEDGDTIAAIKNGEELEAPLWIRDRFEALGIDVETWRERFRG